MVDYFGPSLPHIFAHRGLAIDVPENTKFAFEKAIKAGATHIETDVRATKDDVAVLVHDPVLEGMVIKNTLFKDLPPYSYKLSDALLDFPSTFFNIDIKSKNAIDATVQVVREREAQNRILIASFSGARRKKTLKRLIGAATSASRSEFVMAFLSSQLGLTSLTKRFLRNVDALQIPTQVFGIKTTHPRVIESLSASGTYVYFWTVNDPEEMRSLLEKGAHGFVTDRTDLARSLISAG